mgnify:CR=1 FL=1
MALEQSILKCVKKNLGLDDAYTAFDHDVITHINTAFFTLNQLGLGPAEGFMVEDSTPEWDAFTDGRINLNAVKSYVYLRVRLLFDPPGTPHHIKALEDQKLELEHRLKMDREIDAWGWPPAEESTLP